MEMGHIIVTSIVSTTSLYFIIYFLQIISLFGCISLYKINKNLGLHTPSLCILCYSPIFYIMDKYNMDINFIIWILIIITVPLMYYAVCKSK